MANLARDQNIKHLTSNGAAVDCLRESKVSDSAISTRTSPASLSTSNTHCQGKLLVVINIVESRTMKINFF